MIKINLICESSILSNKTFINKLLIKKIAKVTTTKILTSAKLFKRNCEKLTRF